MASGTQNLTSDKARVLSTQPGTNKFWRGDNSWSNILGGNLTIEGNVYFGNSSTSNFISIHGLTGDNPIQDANHFFIGNRHWADSESSELVFFAGNDIGNGNSAITAYSSGPDRIRHIAGAHIFQTYTSALTGTFEEVCTSNLLVNIFEINTNNILSHKQMILEENNSWLSPARLQLLRPDTTAYTDRACIGVTDGNLHIDPYPNKGLYLNYYNSGGNVYFNGSSYYINAGYYNGKSENSETARSLYMGAIGNGTESKASALTTWFNNNKNNIPRNKLISVYGACENNGVQLFGYYLSGYDSAPYGGFFCSHYDTPYYIGISAGSYNQKQLVRWNDSPTFNVVTATGQPGFYSLVGAGSWSYLRLHNGSNFWDVATNRDSSAGAIELRINGTDIGYYFNTSDVPEGADNLAAASVQHSIKFYRNGILIPYQMDNANDGGMLRCRGTSESNTILELATWDDYGSGETIQFNYYPTTSQVSPTYSIWVPKANGQILYASYGTIAGFRNEGAGNQAYYWGFGGGSSETYAVHWTNLNAGYASSAGNADTVDGYHHNYFLHAWDWWSYDNGAHCDNLHYGSTFCYTTHGAPTAGMLVAFDCSNSHGYTLQLQGSYGSNTLYMRNRQGDGGWWHSWKQVACYGESPTFGYITVSASSGTEGGEICLSAATSYGYPACMDVWQSRWRIHSNSYVRFWVDLTSGSHSDYAEERTAFTHEPGCVYNETNECILIKTNKRLIPGCSVCSDTYGTVISGKEGDIPFAVSGRVLVYTYKPREQYQAGMAVCSAPNGTVDIMTREEIKEYPDCILGYVAGIPLETSWSDPNTKLNGRIWIRLA